MNLGAGNVNWGIADSREEWWMMPAIVAMIPAGSGGTLGQVSVVCVGFDRINITNPARVGGNDGSYRAEIRRHIGGGH